MSEGEALEYFKTKVDQYGGQRAFAKHHKLSPPYINDVYHGRRALGPSILSILGLYRKVTIEFKEVGDA